MAIKFNVVPSVSVACALLLVVIQPVEQCQCLFRIAAQGKRTKADFGIVRRQDRGGQLFNQLVDAEVPRFGELFQTLVFVVGESDGHGGHLNTSRHCFGVKIFVSEKSSSAFFKSRVLRDTIACAPPATANSIK